MFTNRIAFRILNSKHVSVTFQSLLDRGKVAVHDLVQRVGFAGILLCASVSLLASTCITILIRS